MRNNLLTVCLLVFAQVLICNYLSLSPYLTLSILPVILFALPTKYGTVATLFIAFAMGLAVDFMAEGWLGLNVVALLPVAALKRALCEALFGDEIIEREESFSFEKYGQGKIIFGITVCQALFLFIYVWADGGSAYPLSFSATRWLVSSVAGVLVSIPLANMITKEDR